MLGKCKALIDKQWNIVTVFSWPVLCPNSSMLGVLGCRFWNLPQFKKKKSHFLRIDLWPFLHPTHLGHHQILQTSPPKSPSNIPLYIHFFQCHLKLSCSGRLHNLIPVPSLEIDIHKSLNMFGKFFLDILIERKTLSRRARCVPLERLLWQSSKPCGWGIGGWNWVTACHFLTLWHLASYLSFLILGFLICNT